MRNIILALLAANILYFLYQQLVEEPPESGVAVVDEDALGPELDITDVPTADAVSDTASATEVATATEPPPELAASVGRSCVTLGPFVAANAADTAMKDAQDDGLRATTRATDGEVFVGHWVQIRDIPDRDTGNEMIASLQEGGLGEAYLVETEDEGLKISLGLFGEMARAERVELQAKSLDLPADIVPRMREAQVFYVDIGLPPGRGAGNLVAKYGEEQVALRGEATCPEIG